MDDAVGTALLLLVMVVGLVGVVVPVLPGTALVLGAGVVWALLVADDGAGRWVVVAVMGALFVVGIALKYALPGRRLSGALPRRTLVTGAVAGVVGLLLLPPLGLLVGAVAGVYLAESARLGPRGGAWGSTVQVLKAVGLGVLAELTAGVLMVAAWLVGVVVV